eukprot:SAG31_NODE_4368_length_3306_cov_15.927346_6_plen_184_part_00
MQTARPPSRPPAKAGTMQRATSSALLAAQLVAALTSAPRSSAQKDLPRAGCYFDNLTVVNSTLVHRQLRHPVCAERGQGMCSEAELTHETCGHACVERGFQLAGLEDHQVRSYFLSFLCPLLEKCGTFIARCNALIEKVSPSYSASVATTSPTSPRLCRAQSASKAAPLHRPGSRRHAVGLLA